MAAFGMIPFIICCRIRASAESDCKAMVASFIIMLAEIM
jgi:hypothetical protein